MAFIPAVNTALCEMVCLWSDQIVENTVYFEKAAAWSEDDLLAVARDMLDWWSAAVAPYTNVNVTLQEIKLTDLTSDTAPSVTALPTTPIPGEVTGDPLPNNCTLSIAFKTAGRGRSSRGRNYVLGLSEANVNGNVVDATTVTMIRNAYVAMESAASVTVPVAHVVVSRFHNHAPRTTALIQHVTSYAIVDPFIDSQRRRLPGRGR